MPRPFIALGIVLLLAGCGHAPLHTEAPVSAEAASPTNARIYFLREKNYIGLLVDYPFQIDGVGKFEIPNGSYFFVDIAPGDYVLRSRSPTLPGEYVIQLKAKSQEIYYVEVDFRQDNVDAAYGASFLGGPLIGWIVQAAEAKENDGPFVLTPLTAEQAKLMMKTLKFRQG